jgi:mRNA interferase MazF
MVKIPDRGDIIFISFDRTKGHEQAGSRPAFVVSPLAFNAKTKTLWACPITNTQRGWAFEVSLDGREQFGRISLKRWIFTLVNIALLNRFL